MSAQSTFEAIRALLSSSRIQSCNDSTLTIRESDAVATLKRVDIVSVGSQAFWLEYDKCKFPGQAVFAAHPSVHRACDSIAFCEVDNEPFILCCELKSSEPSRHEVVEQFRSAHCFLTYLDALLQHYCEGQSIADWQRRYFVFHNQGATPVSKRPSMDERANTTPETALFIPTQTGAKQYVRQLLGKPL
jgi:hypothetical protein